jgi:hypothetical protein
MKLVIRIPVVRIVVLKADIQTCRYHVVYLYSHNAKLGILAARAEGLGNISISRQRPSKENDFKSRRGVYLSKLSVRLFGFLCGRYAWRPVDLLHVRPCGLCAARSVGRSLYIYHGMRLGCFTLRPGQRKACLFNIMLHCTNSDLPACRPPWIPDEMPPVRFACPHVFREGITPPTLPPPSKPI